MDGVHDLGGKPGFGGVDRGRGDEVFHDRWEAAVFAMIGAGYLAGGWKNGDRFRHAIERIDPEAYLTHGYYGRWLGGIETLLVEAGILTTEEITARAVSLGASTNDLIAARPSSTPDPQGTDPISRDSIRPLDRAPVFSVGEQVKTRSEPEVGHTRLPAYARGKVGRDHCLASGMGVSRYPCPWPW